MQLLRSGQGGQLFRLATHYVCYLVVLTFFGMQGNTARPGRGGIFLD